MGEKFIKGREQHVLPHSIGPVVAKVHGAHVAVDTEFNFWETRQTVRHHAWAVGDAVGYDVDSQPSCN